MHKDLSEILFTEEEILSRIKEIAKEIDETYKGEEVVMVCIMKGSLPFYADLVRAVSFPAYFDFMCVSSYGASTTTSGELKMKLDLSMDIENKHVLIIEDILDTGNTLYNLREMLTKRSPKSLRICALLDKPARRLRDIEADFTGFEIPDAFVVGYGLDYNEHYRNLPYIGILKPEVYENH